MKTIWRGVPAALILLLVVGSANAGITLFLSDKGYDEGASLGNPSITLPNVGATTTLYIWADVSEKVIALGMNLVSSDTAILEATANDIYNPTHTGATPPFTVTYRWGLPVGDGVLGDLVTDINAVAISKELAVAGLDPGWAYDGYLLYDEDVGAFLVGEVTIQGTAEGTTDLYMTVSDNRIAPAVGFSPDLDVWFGSGDASLLGDSVDVQSAVADGTVTVVPEPVTLSILGLGVLGLLRRRR